MLVKFIYTNKMDNNIYDPEPWFFFFPQIPEVGPLVMIPSIN